MQLIAASAKSPSLRKGRRRLGHTLGIMFGGCGLTARGMECP